MKLAILDNEYGVVEAIRLPEDGDDPLDIFEVPDLIAKVWLIKYEEYELFMREVDQYKHKETNNK